jgi:uncharacterized protein YqfB (UPF0267 family)
MLGINNNKKITIEEKITNIKDDLQLEVTIFETKTENALNLFKVTYNELDNLEKSIDNKTEMLNTYVDELKTLIGNLYAKRECNNKIKNKLEEFLL